MSIGMLSPPPLRELCPMFGWNHVVQFTYRLPLGRSYDLLGRVHYGKWRSTKINMTFRSMNWGIGWATTDWIRMINLLAEGEWK